MLVPPNYRGVHDRDGDELAVTGDGELVFLTRSHQKIHEGRSYELTVTDTLASGGTREIGFETPASPEFLHIVAEALVANAVTFEIEEAVGPISGGASLTPRNRNRSLPDASGISGAQTAASLTYTAGTVIHSRSFGAKADAESSGNFDREWILKASTRYVFRLTSGANGNVVSLILNWYEDTYNGESS